MRILPLKTGSIHCSRTVLTYGKGFDESIEIPALAWYVEQEGRKILIDTGMCSTERAQTYHYPGSIQGEGERIDEVLRSKGIQPESIEVVILTHLHWDHCANLGRFREADIFVQQAEFEYAANPLPPYYRSYESPRVGLKPSYDGLDLCFLEGDQEIVPGVQVLLTPGHSPGHQSVLIEGQDSQYLIAGDACLCYENLSPHKEKGLEFTMIGRYMDVNQAWRSLERIKSTGAVILPGHEIGVLAQEEYN